MADGLGVFRKRDFGDVEVDVNSRSMTSDRYVDRSRLDSHEEYRANENPMKPGRIVEVQNSLMDNARTGMDAMKHRSSFRNQATPRIGDGGNLSAPWSRDEGPATRKRGDD